MTARFWRCAGMPRPMWGPICAPTGRPARATPHKSCPGHTACPISTCRCHSISPTKTPVGTYRGPGRFEADFFRERVFDMAAGDLGIDRVAFRRRNLIAESEMPYALAKVVSLTSTPRRTAAITAEPSSVALRKSAGPPRRRCTASRSTGAYRDGDRVLFRGWRLRPA